MLTFTEKALGDLEPTALEVYDDGVAVRWQHRRLRSGWALRLELHDDVGTVYETVGAVMHGGPGAPRLPVTRGETVLVPAPPLQATRLRLLAEGSETDLDLNAR